MSTNEEDFEYPDPEATAKRFAEAKVLLDMLWDEYWRSVFIPALEFKSEPQGAAAALRRRCARTTTSTATGDVCPPR